MEKFWTILSTNHDVNGLEFISLLEATDYPIWGSQFHPEKNAYEWTLKYPRIPHDSDSIHSAAFFAEFFVEHTRQNNHRFIDRQAEEEHLIYNFKPFFTGDIKTDSTMEQCYLF